jgi:hypothetical protein
MRSSCAEPVGQPDDVGRHRVGQVAGGAQALGDLVHAGEAVVHQLVSVAAGGRSRRWTGNSEMPVRSATRPQSPWRARN